MLRLIGGRSGSVRPVISGQARTGLAVDGGDVGGGTCGATAWLRSAGGDRRGVGLDGAVGGAWHDGVVMYARGSARCRRVCGSSPRAGWWRAWALHCPAVHLARDRAGHPVLVAHPDVRAVHRDRAWRCRRGAGHLAADARADSVGRSGGGAVLGPQAWRFDWVRERRRARATGEAIAAPALRSARVTFRATSGRVLGAETSDHVLGVKVADHSCRTSLRLPDSAVLKPN